MPKQFRFFTIRLLAVLLVATLVMPAANVFSPTNTAEAAPPQPSPCERFVAAANVLTAAVRVQAEHVGRLYQELSGLRPGSRKHTEKEREIDQANRVLTRIIEERNAQLALARECYNNQRPPVPVGHP